MSFIVRRQLSTLIPPKIASASNLGSAPNAKRMANVVSFYKALPRGDAPASKPGFSLVARYKAKYFNDDAASGKPLLHVSAVVLIVGYSLEYYYHLRHHKDGGEH